MAGRLFHRNLAALCLALCASGLRAADESARDLSIQPRAETPALSPLAPLGSIATPLSAPALEIGAPPVAAAAEAAPQAATLPSLPQSSLAPQAQPNAVVSVAAPAAPSATQKDPPVEQLTVSGSVRFDRAGSAAQADPGFEEYLKRETGFGLSALRSMGLPPDQVRRLREAYDKQKPSEAADFPAGPPPAGAPSQPGKPAGRLRIRSAGRESDVAVQLNRKPDAMEATFLGVDGAGAGVAVKTAQYVSVEPKSEAQAQAALGAEAASLKTAAEIARKKDFPADVSVPALLGLGYMDESLAARIYGKPQRVPVLLMKRSPGVTIENWLNSGRALDARSFADLIRAVKLLHASGLAHGDLNVGNILVREDQATGRQHFVLVDFGAALKRGAADAAHWEAVTSDDLKALSEIVGFFRKKGRLAARP